MDDLLREVIDIFVAEVREQADRISQALLTMEQQPSTIPTEIEELYRQAHSLKGSSASLGVEELSQLAHHLESALLPVRRHRSTLTAEMVDLGLKALDAVKLRVVGLLADNEVGLAEVHRFAEQLEQLAQRHPLPAPSVGAQAVVDASAAPIESPPDDLRSDDIGEPIFAGASEAPDSVRVSIEKLAALIQHTDDLRRLRGQLERHQSEVTTMLRGLEKLLRTNAKNGDPDLKRTDEEIQHVVRGLRAMRRDLLDDIEGLQSTTGELDDGLRAIQLLPAALLSQPLHRGGRAACRSTSAGGSVALLRRK